MAFEESRPSARKRRRVKIARTHDQTNCILCVSSESREIQIGVRYQPEAVVRSCKVCDLVFLSPRPSPSKLAAYYTSAYRAEYHEVVSPESTHRSGVEEARSRVKRLLPYLRPSMRVLEVGASAGAFLEAVRPYVQSVIGVELDEAHRSWATNALGVPIVSKLTDVGEQRFDLIGLFHTLEHVPNPVDFLGDLSAYLVRGGRIAIELPNVTDALIALYKIPAFSDFYYQRAHLYYFSARTLAKTIQAAGGNAEIAGIQRYDLSNHLRWLITGRPGGQGYYQETFSDVVQVAYGEALIRAGYADTLWAVASFGADEVLGPSDG